MTTKYVMTGQYGHPHGWLCGICHKTIKVGNRAIVTKEAKGNMAYHDWCMVGLLNTEPVNIRTEDSLLKTKLEEEAALLKRFEEIKRSYDNYVA